MARLKLSSSSRYVTAVRQMGFYLVTSVVFMLIMVVAFTVFFYYAEDFGGWLDTFYFVVITVRTIGFGDFTPDSSLGKLGTIFLAILPATVFLGASLVVLETIMKSLEQVWKEWMLEKNKDHTIVIADLDLLQSIVHELAAHEHPFVIVHNRAMLDLPAPLGQWTLDSNYLYGDPKHDQTLEQARIQQASHIIIATDSDADNLYILVTAKGLNPDIHATVRVNHEMTQERFRTVGADYLLPSSTIVGRMLSQAAVSPICSNFLVQLNTRTHDPFLIQEPVTDAQDGKPVREEFPKAVALFSDGEYRYNVEKETLRLGDIVLSIDEKLAPS